MSRKVFSLHDTAVDKEGVQHEVTIVGVYTNKNETETRGQEVNLELEDGKIVTAFLTMPKKQRVRTLRYAFSICNPEDEFNEQEGIKIAERRTKTNPLGELKTTFITSLCKDQVEHILRGELNYIIDNIDKFIEK